jgi:hypothetical protein
MRQTIVWTTIACAALGLSACSRKPAGPGAAKGTSGTPTVETRTDLDVRRVDATSLKPIGAACQP